MINVVLTVWHPKVPPDQYCQRGSGQEPCTDWQHRIPSEDFLQTPQIPKMPFENCEYRRILLSQEESISCHGAQSVVWRAVYSGVMLPNHSLYCDVPFSLALIGSPLLWFLYLLLLPQILYYWSLRWGLRIAKNQKKKKTSKHLSKQAYLWIHVTSHVLTYTHTKSTK